MRYLPALAFALMVASCTPAESIYPWQNRCDAACAAALGPQFMAEIDQMDCTHLEAMQQLYWAFEPDQVDNYTYRLVALGDKLPYDRCH